MKFEMEEEAAKIIDDLLCLYELWPNGEVTTNNSITRDALSYIAKIRHRNPNHPITVSLANHMRQKGLVE